MKEKTLSEKELEEKYAVLFPRTKAGNDMLKDIIRRAKEMGYNACEEKYKEAVEKLKKVLFNKEKELSSKIQGPDFHNGYSCACDWIRTEIIKKIFGEFK